MLPSYVYFAWNRICTLNKRSISKEEEKKISQAEIIIVPITNAPIRCMCLRKLKDERMSNKAKKKIYHFIIIYWRKRESESSNYAKRKGTMKSESFYFARFFSSAIRIVLLYTIVSATSENTKEESNWNEHFTGVLHSREICSHANDIKNILTYKREEKKKNKPRWRRRHGRRKKISNDMMEIFNIFKHSMSTVFPSLTYRN